MIRLLLASVFVLALGGCATAWERFNTGMMIVTDEGCSSAGLAARASFRAAQDVAMRDQDKALGMRCPGDDAPKFTGNPFPNGVPQSLIEKYGVLED